MSFDFISFMYVILAILGLSFLIFIHELGHYFMARRQGMRVETFSIGIGKPFYSWEKDNVKWQIGWLLFGGYVKVAGSETSDQQNMYEVKDGFFGKGPLARIKVAFMGPFVNIVFALIAFFFLWLAGGREKNFSDYTHKIGWIDPKSEIYAKGVRLGDEIVSFNDQDYQGSKDLLIAPLTSGDTILIKGNHVDSTTKEKTPFEYRVKTYPNPISLNKEVVTSGILQPASYVIYDKLPGGVENPLPEGSPMQDSGIEYGDRIIWVDGVAIYSVTQLNQLLNDSRTLLTIEREKNLLLRRVPRVKADELKLDPEFKEELVDWQFEADLKNIKLQNLYTIPYSLSPAGIVESQVPFIDKEKEEEFFPSHSASLLESPLQKGDKVLAVDGMPISHSYEILSHLQKRHVNIIVERDGQLTKAPSWKLADKNFDQQSNAENLQKLSSQIGLASPSYHAGNLVLLKPVEPKMRKDFPLSQESRDNLAHELVKQQKEVENIEDPELRKQMRHFLENRDKQVLLGLPSIQDEHVWYNPNPFELFYKVFEEIWQTLKALFSGSLNLKWMSGPIGIVQLVHDNSMVSLKESLYWLGAISLNLGILNLLPLPVLDGGTICFALYELITGRKLKAKTLERWIIPFAILLIGLFIFLTYHDLAWLFSTLMNKILSNRLTKSRHGGKPLL